MPHSARRLRGIRAPVRLALLHDLDAQVELRERHPDLNVVAVIADIRDQRRIRQVFERLRPAIVLHAAAHKHVPLMEENPEEAITNIGVALLLMTPSSNAYPNNRSADIRKTRSRCATATPDCRHTCTSGIVPRASAVAR